MINVKSRFTSASMVNEVVVHINTQTGQEEVLRSEKFLDADRREYRPEDFQDNIFVQPRQGETPDMVCHRIYRDSTLVWVLCDFNDWVAQNPFIRFQGENTERLVLPSRQTMFSVIAAPKRVR